ncbi:DUF1885 family protein [Peribacillus sp. SCS-37]|uniref:DUF1885 family protein n=1 Tax=Paraperibacillus esterisolvens TaxID=3115296 RepID=UPI00390671D9
MTETAYIKLVEQSKQQTITLDELKNWLRYYQEITAKTGRQVGCNYSSMAFPYEIDDTPSDSRSWFTLTSSHDRYNAIIMGVAAEKITGDQQSGKLQSAIHITLPPASTFGDKGKANEFSKFLAKQLEGELHLFNGRVMFFYKRR